VRFKNSAAYEQTTHNMGLVTSIKYSLCNPCSYTRVRTTKISVFNTNSIPSDGITTNTETNLLLEVTGVSSKRVFMRSVSDSRGCNLNLLTHLVLKLVLLLLLPSLDHHHLPLQKSLTAHFVMHLLAFGINFRPHSINLILIILFLTLLNRIL